MRKYFVRDIMTTTPKNVDENASAKVCAELMTSKGVGSLLVLKGKEFVGIITEQDLVTKVVAKGLVPAEVIVKDIMTSAKSIVSIESTRSVYSAMYLMNGNDVRRLPVIDNGDLKGIVTMKDVFGIEPDLLENMFDFIPEEHK